MDGTEYGSTFHSVYISTLPGTGRIKRPDGSTFHSVYISTEAFKEDIRYSHYSTFHSVYISTLNPLK